MVLSNFHGMILNSCVFQALFIKLEKLLCGIEKSVFVHHGCDFRVLVDL